MIEIFETRVCEETPDQHFVGLTKVTIDRILKTDNPADALALYSFYCYTSKWQKTTSVKCTSEFVMKGLKIGKDRFSAAKRILIELGLIENQRDVGEDGRVKGCYIGVRFLISTYTQNHLSGFPPGGESGDKCLVTGNRNALKTGNRIIRKIESSTSRPINGSSFSHSNDPIKEGSDGAIKSPPVAQPPPHEEIQRAWNTLDRQPKALSVSSGRKSHIKQRLLEPFFRENWKTAIERLRKSDFCAGVNERGWTADFDWFIRPSSVEKIMEGKYDNRRAVPREVNCLGGGRNDDVNPLGIGY